MGLAFELDSSEEDLLEMYAKKEQTCHTWSSVFTMAKNVCRVDTFTDRFVVFVKTSFERQSISASEKKGSSNALQQLGGKELLELRRSQSIRKGPGRPLELVLVPSRSVRQRVRHHDEVSILTTACSDSNAL